MLISFLDHFISFLEFATMSKDNGELVKDAGPFTSLSDASIISIYDLVVFSFPDKILFRNEG